MSSVSPPSQQSDGRNSIQKAVDWNVKHRARITTAHEGMMLEKIMRQNRIVEIDARNAMTNKPDDVEGWPSVEDTDMSVKVGDEVHNHYYQQTIQQEAPVNSDKPTNESGGPGAEPSPEKSQPSLLQRVLPYALLFGLGGGTAAGIDVFKNWLFPSEPQAPVEFQDTDTHIGIEAEVFGPGEGG